MRVVVQQPRGTVQPDRRLARARTALDDERGHRWLADHRILLGRDRGDDLAHLADAAAGDVLDDRLRQVAVAVALERLVDEPQDPPVLEVEPPTTRDPARVVRGRGVERLRRRRAPVAHEDLVVAVDDDVAADVQRPAADRVDAPEVQRPARLGVHADPSRRIRSSASSANSSTLRGRARPVRRRSASSKAANVSSRRACSRSSSPLTPDHSRPEPFPNPSLAERWPGPGRPLHRSPACWLPCTQRAHGRLT